MIYTFIPFCPASNGKSRIHDIYFHRKVGKDMFYANSNQIREARSLISGVLILTSKKVWKQVGGFMDGFTKVDHDYDLKSRNAGYTTYIADGLYIYHWYRAAPEGPDCLPCGYASSTFLAPV